MRIVLALLLSWLPLFAHAAERWHERADWRREFATRGVSGTLLVYDEHAGLWSTSDTVRARTPFIPASTFKLFNALVALDTGAVKDEFEVLRWNDSIPPPPGWKREGQPPAWTRDQNLASALKVSAVWFYQEIARRVGVARMQEWIDKADYGNHDISGGIDRFWLTGALRISAQQQIRFMRRLADGSLPFSARAQETVRRIAVIESAPQYLLRGKTGWARRPDVVDLGWQIGWIERGGRRWFYALNIDMPNSADAAQRDPIVRAALRDVGALPKN